MNVLIGTVLEDIQVGGIPVRYEKLFSGYAGL